MGQYYDWAEGPARDTRGGQGGINIQVTRLTDDTNPGSLRYVVEDRGGVGRRQADFSSLLASEYEFLIDQEMTVAPDLTIDGSTHKHGAISIRQTTEGLLGPNGVFKFTGSEVAIRYVCFSPSWGIYGARGPSCILMEGPIKNIILDRCTLRWALDKHITIFNDNPGPEAGCPSSITIQHCLLYEMLRCSTHEKTVTDNPSYQPGPCGPYGNQGHSRSVTISRGASYEGTGCQDILFYCCITANCQDRNPFNTNDAGPTHAVNCIVYNPEDQGLNATSKYQVSGHPSFEHSTGGKVNAINSMFIQGPDTVEGCWAFNLAASQDSQVVPDSEAYISGIVLLGDRLTLFSPSTGDPTPFLKDEPIQPYTPPYVIRDTEDALWFTLQTAGAHADWHDDRVKSYVRGAYFGTCPEGATGTGALGKIIDDPSEYDSSYTDPGIPDPP